jgi:uncharacterized protein YecT (DUF1311 family)
MKRLILHIVILIISSFSLGIADICSDPKTQRDINLCAKKEYKETENKLNILYSNLLENFHKKEKKNFNFARDIWIQYRDAQCEAEAYKHKGGSILPFIEYKCLTTLTEHRIKIIRFLYENK